MFKLSIPNWLRRVVPFALGFVGSGLVIYRITAPILHLPIPDSVALAASISIFLGIWAPVILILWWLIWRVPSPPMIADTVDESPTTDSGRLERLDNHIKFEFELTSQRVTYLAIAESFLFGVYATSLTQLKAPTPDLLHADSVERLLHAVPWVGVALAAVVWIAVVCAVSMTFKLKAAREVLERKKPLHTDIGWRSLEHFLGLSPPIVIPIAFITAWLYVWPH